MASEVDCLSRVASKSRGVHRQVQRDSDASGSLAEYTGGDGLSARRALLSCDGGEASGEWGGGAGSMDLDSSLYLSLQMCMESVMKVSVCRIFFLLVEIGDW